MYIVFTFVSFRKQSCVSLLVFIVSTNLLTLSVTDEENASLILFNAHNRLIESSLQNNLHIFEAFAHGSLFIAP